MRYVAYHGLFLLLFTQCATSNASRHFKSPLAMGRDAFKSKHASSVSISGVIDTGVNSKGKAITYDNNTNCVRLSYDSFPLFCSFNQKPPLLSAPHGK